MTVVVEGPSGAGKTTWCRTHGRGYALLEELPDHLTVPSEPEAQARFWVQRNVARWREVTSGHSGALIRCRSGNGTSSARRRAKRSARADTHSPISTSCRNVDEETLRARRDADTTRTRRGFERHVLLRKSLLRWYRAIDELEPGRVRFGLPETGLTPDLLALGPRKVRSGADLFERLLARLD